MNTLLNYVQTLSASHCQGQCCGKNKAFSTDLPFSSVTNIWAFALHAEELIYTIKGTYRIWTNHEKTLAKNKFHNLKHVSEKYPQPFREWK